MNRFARTVLAYHGCDPAFAEAMIRGEIDVAEWKVSRNDYDWLGHGIYFWEYAPERAATWRRKGGVVGAIVQLGNCLDLTDTASTRLLAQQFQAVRIIYGQDALPLPDNKRGRNILDCLVINELDKAARVMPGVAIDTVRRPYLEGDPVFEGSKILTESHIQLPVRNVACILGVFRPTPNFRGVAVP